MHRESRMIQVEKRKVGFSTLESSPLKDAQTSNNLKVRAGNPYQHPHATEREALKRSSSFRYKRFAIPKNALIVLNMMHMLYYILSIPFRIGFLFDPFDQETSNTATVPFLFFLTCDIFADCIGLYSYMITQQDGRRERIKSIAGRLQMQGGSGAVAMKGSKTAVSRVNRRSYGRVSGLFVLSLNNTSIKKDLYGFSLYETSVFVAAMIPYDLVVIIFQKYNYTHIARIPKLIKIVHFHRFWNPLYIIMAKKQNFRRFLRAGILRVVQLFVIVTVACHLCACGFMFIAHYTCGLTFGHCPGTNQENSSWAVNDQLIGASTWRKYARSIYWAVITIITVGYGDIVPVSNIETFYTIIVEIVGAALSTAVIAAFSFIFRNLNLQNSEFTNHVDNVTLYLKARKIPQEIKSNVEAYFDYFWKTHHGAKQVDVMKLIPPHFRTRCISGMLSERVRKVPIFKNENCGFVYSLVSCLENRVYSPSDWIIHGLGFTEMYFVCRGKVSLMVKNDVTNATTKVEELGDGDFFGELALFLDSFDSELAISETFSEVHALSRTLFKHTVQKYYQNDSDQLQEQMLESLMAYRKQQLKSKKLFGNRVMNNASDDSSTSRKNYFLPDSSFRRSWNVAIILALFYIIINVPFQIVFIDKSDDFSDLKLFEMMQWSVELFFMVDFYFKCRKFAFVDVFLTGQSTPIEDSSLIYSYYKSQFGFKIDFIVNICSFIILILRILLWRYLHGTRYLQLVSSVRTLRLHRLLKESGEFFSHLNVSSATKRMSYLVVGVLFLLHIVGCFWYLISYPSESLILKFKDRTIPFSACLLEYQNDNSCSWVVFDNLEGESYFFSFLRSIYWAVIALTTVGYGDIRAITTTETYVTFLWILIGGFINYGVVGAMSSSISQITARESDHFDMLTTMNVFMEFHNIPKTLRKSIREFYLNQWSRQKGISESDVLNSLPNNLKQRITDFLHGNLVSKISIFSGCCNPFIIEITTRFNQQYYQRYDIIISEGTESNKLFMLTKGRVEVLSSTFNYPLDALEEGECFGESTFLSSERYQTYVRAASFCEVSILHKNDFDKVIEKYPSNLKLIQSETLVMHTAECTMIGAILGNFKRPKMKSFTEGCISLYSEPEIEPGIIPPNNYFRHVWEIIVGIVIFYNALQLVFRIVFLRNPKKLTSNVLMVIDLLCDLTLVLDIYLKYNHFGFMHADEIVVKKSKIQEHYRKTHLSLDLLASLPFYYYSNESSMLLLRLPRLIRSRYLPEFFSRYQMIIQEHYASARTTSMLGLMKLFLVLFMSSHYFACLFYFIGSFDKEGLSWINNDIVASAGSTVVMKYVRSLYWSLATLTLVVYGDIVPKTFGETVFTFFVCLAGFFIIGHVIGEFTALILHMDNIAFMFDKKIRIFDKYAENQKLPAILRGRASQYFEFQFECSKGLVVDEVFPSLSSSLSRQLHKGLHQDILSVAYIFTNMNEAQTFSVAEKLRTELFLPDDYILGEGDIGTKLYIMKRGRAEVFSKRSNAAFAAIYENSVFGEIAFFIPNQKRIASVRAVVLCQTVYVEKFDWDNIFKNSSNFIYGKTKNIPLDMQASAMINRKIYLRASSNIIKNLKIRQGGKIKKMLFPNQLLLFDKNVQNFGDRKHSTYWGLLKAKFNRKGMEKVVPAFYPQRRKQMHPTNCEKSENPPSIKEIRESLKDANYGGHNFDSSSKKPLKRSQSFVCLEKKVDLPSRDDMNCMLTHTPAPKNSNIPHEFIDRLCYLEQSEKRRKTLSLAKNAVNAFAFDIWMHVSSPLAFTRKNSRFQLIWFKIELFIVLYNAFIIPYRICFSQDYSTTIILVFSILDYTFDLIYVADILLKWFYFTFEVGGEVISDRGLVRANYRKTKALYYDVFASIPFELLVLVFDFKCQLCAFYIFRVNRLARLFHLAKLLKRFEEYLVNDVKLPINLNFLRFTKVLIGFCAASHWIGCIWYYVGYMLHSSSGSKQITTWVTTPGMIHSNGNLELSSGYRKYLRSLYYGFTSTTTVGYGDIVSTNLVETFAQLAIILFSISLFGMLVGTHDINFEISDGDRAKFEQKVELLSGFMISHGLPRQFRSQIQLYFRNLWSQQNGIDELQALMPLSTILKQDIALYVKQNIISIIHLFNNCEANFIRALAVILKAELFVKDDVIIEEGDIDRGMYFIERGEILITNKKRTYEVIKRAGDYFGELSLLYNVPRSANCSALSECSLYLLDLEKYEEVLKEFPEYVEKNRREWVLSNAPLVEKNSGLRAKFEIAASLNNEDATAVLFGGRSLTKKRESVNYSEPKTQTDNFMDSAKVSKNSPSRICAKRTSLYGFYEL